jgi:hypothetical protein
MGGDAFANGFHNLEVDPQQVIAAHARLARDTGGDDANISARNIFIRLSTRHFSIEFGGWAAFGDVQRLAFGDAFGNVEQDDIAQLFEGSKMGKGATDLTSADQRNFGSGQGKMLRFGVEIATLLSNRGELRKLTRRRGACPCRLRGC